MAQETIETTKENVDYTLQSTTDSTTLTLSDDKFAEIVVMQNLTTAINNLTKAIRSKR